jgi:hypothetical protein
MNLELTDQEKDKLILVLEHFIPNLRAEIASGVKHDWKVELHKEEDILKAILEKLKGLK